MKNYTNATELEKHEFHYAIWQARKEKGLPVFGTVTIEDHPLLNARFFEDGRWLTVERVYLQWCWGYYLLCILYHNDEYSHGTRFIAKWTQIYDMNSLKDKARTIVSTEAISIDD